MILEVIDEGIREPDQDGPTGVCCMLSWMVWKAGVE